MDDTGRLAACRVPNIMGSNCLSLAMTEAFLTNKHQTSPVNGPASKLVCSPSGMRFNISSKHNFDCAICVKSPESVLDSEIACKTVGIVRIHFSKNTRRLCT